MTRRIIFTVLVSGSAGVLITGCAVTGRQMARPDARPLGAQYAAAGRDTEPAASGISDPAAPEPTGTLTLPQALAAALLRNPELTAVSCDVRAAEARVMQARLRPNPELEVEIEEVNRDGAGFDTAVTTVGLGQRVELGNKRHWRTRIAETEGELADWDYESKRLGVFTTTTKRFVAVIAAQRRLELAVSVVALAEKTRHAVGERVKAGKEPPLQAAKAEGELEIARMEASDAQSRFEVSRLMLASTWGSQHAAFTDVAGDLNGVQESIPPLESLRSRMLLNPELARWNAVLRLKHSAVLSEMAARVPDVETTVGLQRFEEDGTGALLLGVGVPLPLFDRNEGNISAAEQELAKADAEHSAAKSRMAAELADVYDKLTSAHRRVLALRSKVIPAMEQAFETSHEGYRQGKFGFLDMLDSQRGLFETKVALLNAQADYHMALADVEGIIGTRVDELTIKKQESW